MHPLRGLIPFFAPYKTRLALAGLSLLAAAISALFLPLVLRNLIDAGFSVEITSAQQRQFLVVFFVAIIIAVFTGLRFYMVSWLGERVTADLRSAVYSRVIRQSPEFFESTHSGEVLSRLNTDTTVIQTLVGSSLSMGLRSVVLILGAVVMLIYTAPVVMGLSLLLALVIVLPAVTIGRRVRKQSRSSQDRVADSSAIATEVLTSLPLVQSYAQENRESQRYRAANETAFLAAIQRNRTRSFLTVFVIVAIFSALLFGLYFGVQAVLSGDLTAGELGQLVLYVVILGSSLAMLSEVMGDILRAAGAAERLIELLGAKTTILTPVNSVPLVKVGGGAEIKFEDVVFHYPSRPGYAALDHLSFEIRPGETIALVGPSGAGKSTVFHLLQRFYDIGSGKILINGTSVQQIALEELRRSMAIVSQESTLFSCNIEDNIRYGEPEASQEVVLKSASAAQAIGFISELPQGLQSLTGERGIRLSGGQKQRIAIARAILCDAPLLLLDEATSALDAQSELAVQQALSEAMRGRTTLVIAHRLATVQAVDRILVMDQGRLVEEGNHAELIRKGGLYAKLAALQFSKG